MYVLPGPSTYCGWSAVAAADWFMSSWPTSSGWLNIQSTARSKLLSYTHPTHPTPTTPYRISPTTNVAGFYQHAINTTVIQNGLQIIMFIFNNNNNYNNYYYDYVILYHITITLLLFSQFFNKHMPPKRDLLEKVSKSRRTLGQIWFQLLNQYAIIICITRKYTVQWIHLAGGAALWYFKFVFICAHNIAE